MAYIQRLAADCKATIKKPLAELTMEEASEMIGQLLERMNGGNEKKTDMRRRYNTWSNGARIGLAFKVCHHQWVKSGTNIFRHKELFVKNVVDTYQLLNEIAEKAEAAS